MKNILTTISGIASIIVTVVGLLQGGITKPAAGIGVATGLGLIAAKDAKNKE